MEVVRLERLQYYYGVTDETTDPTTLTSDTPETSTVDWTPTPVTGCIGVDSPSIMIECDPGSTINITKGGCVRVPSCDAYDPSLESQCDDGDKTAQWAPYCEIRNPCNITSSCSAGTTCMGEYAYIYVDYECIADGTTEATSGPTSQAPVSGIADETTEATSGPTSQGQVSAFADETTTESTSGPTSQDPVSGFADETTEATIGPSSQAPVSAAETTEATIGPTSQAPVSAFEDEPIGTTSGPTSPAPVSGFADEPTEATIGPTSQAPVSGMADETTGATRGTTSQAPVSDPVPLRGNVVRRKATLFKQIERGRLRNHAIKTKHGSSFVRCVFECNELDDCVSFNIGNGVCELNNQVVGGTGVDGDDFVKDEGLKYYEKQ